MAMCTGWLPVPGNVEPGHMQTERDKAAPTPNQFKCLHPSDVPKTGSLLDVGNPEQLMGMGTWSFKQSYTLVSKYLEQHWFVCHTT